MRRTPYDIAFGPEAEARFATIRDSLARTGRDPLDPDAFVLDPEVVTYLRELVPEEGVGEGVAEHIALLHHAYLYWGAGGWLFRFSRESAARLVAGAPPSPPAAASVAAERVPAAYYLQFPERLFWAELATGEPHQPLDGLFVRPWPGGGLFVLAVFGLHPGQLGFSVVAAEGYPTGAVIRASGDPLFASVIEGGAAGGLFSITGEEELLELAARAAPAVAGQCGADAGRRAHSPVEVTAT